MRPYSLFKEKIWGRRVVTQTLLLMSGTGLSQVILIGVTPVLTRLISPDVFGYFAQYLALINIAALVACGRYDIALPLPRDEDLAHNLLALCLGLSLAISALFAVGLWVWEKPILVRLAQPGLAPLIHWVPLGIFLTTVLSTFNYWNTRHQQFGRMASGKVVQTSAGGAFQLIAVWLSPEAIFLVFGQLFGLLGGLLWQGSQAILRPSWLKKVSWTGILSAAREYRDFPKYNALGAFLGMGSKQLPLFLFGALFSPQISGFYALILRAISVPNMLIGGAVGQVYYQRIAAKPDQPREVLNITLQVWKSLALLGALPLVALLIAGPQLFAMVFGEAWRTAGEYARILAVMQYVNFISSPTSSCYLYLNKQNISVLFGVGVLLGRGGSIFLASHMDNVLLAFWLMAIFEIIQVLLYNISAVRWLKTRFSMASCN